MDIFTHAAVGAATGAVFGYPITGAVLACVPDIVLGVKRLEAPTRAYDWTHSLSYVALSALTCGLFFGQRVAWCVFFVLLSHLVLDAKTHGSTWAPPLLYPFSDVRFSLGDEWEWFNLSWWDGWLLAFQWISICLLLIVLFG